MSQGYLGEIRIFAGPDLPKGWLPCDGQTVSFRENINLHYLLDRAYDTTGRSFDIVLPDLRQRLATGASTEQPPGSGGPNYTGRVGAGVTADNAQPFLGMTFGICVAGEFPTPFQPPRPPSPYGVEQPRP